MRAGTPISRLAAWSPPALLAATSPFLYDRQPKRFPEAPNRLGYLPAHNSGSR